MNDWLRIDFEVRSHFQVEDIGLYNYATHPSTLPVLLAYKLKGVLKVHEFEDGPLPEDLIRALNDPSQIITAFNSQYERYILQYKLGIIVPASRFQDPQASARYLSLPASLEDVCSVLALPSELQKDSRGKDLIKLFCEPVKPRLKKDAGQPWYFNDRNSHPKEWAEFVEYNRQDVVAEEEVARRLSILKVFPLPERERKLWIFDQKVNDRGFPIGRQFMEKAFAIADKAKDEAEAAQNLLTGLENSNSVTQLLPWVRQRGYPRGTLNKDVVKLILKDPEVKLEPLCRTVLEKRVEAASTTYTKIEKMLAHSTKDDLLCNQFIFMGSSRAGRWSSGAAQLHNMARPNQIFESIDNLNWGRSIVYANDYEALKLWYGNPLITVKNLIRTVFEAPKGQRFNVCDLNAIETRVGAWVAQCPSLMDVFVPRPGMPKGKDPYIDFAVKMYGIPYEKLWADYKSKDDAIKAAAKAKRQIAKPGVLGAIYRLSGGTWGRSPKGYKEHGEECNAQETYVLPNGKVKKIGKKDCRCPEVHDRIKTGLWGYAENMGVDMTEEQANEVVRIFRESYPEIVQCWYDLENAVADVLQPNTTAVVRTIGPEGCIKIDKITVKNYGVVLRIQLPSGRYLHYIDARLEEMQMPWKDREGNPVYKECLVYAGINQETKQWERYTTSHGGKIFENIVQAIARDILADKLLEIETLGIEICAHVHDEGIGLTANEPMQPGVKEMEYIMSQPVAWAPGLILAAEGFESQYYHK